MPKYQDLIDNFDPTTFDASKPFKRQRWEHFCRLIVSGIKTHEAYAQAGYRPDQRNADNLKSRPEITARIEYLQNEAAKQIGIDKGKILLMLLEDRELAREFRQCGSAVKVDELIGKELGMFKERKETTIDVSRNYADLLKEISGETAPLLNNLDEGEAELDHPLKDIDPYFVIR